MGIIPHVYFSILELKLSSVAHLRHFFKQSFFVSVYRMNNGGYEPSWCRNDGTATEDSSGIGINNTWSLVRLCIYLNLCWLYGGDFMLFYKAPCGSELLRTIFFDFNNKNSRTS